MGKIVDAIRKANEESRQYFGFEFVAPTTESGLVTFYDRVERMSGLDPLFCGITWGDYGRTADTSIEVASTCQTLLSVNFQVNLTSYTATPEEIDKWLGLLQGKGVRNILATRGNTVGPAKDGKVHFPHASDLIRYVRGKYGDYFDIAAVAFPESEEEGWNVEKEIEFLKEKVSAGADYVVTSSVFDAGVFIDFCARCRRSGIKCPILPGILPIAHPRQLNSFHLANLTGVSELRKQLEGCSAADCKQVVVSFMVDLVKALFAGGICGVYFFTMNVENIVSAIVKSLKMPTHRAYPWKPSENEERRRKEMVRPVHWSTRVMSYLARTSHWEEFQSSDKWITATVPTHSHPQSQQSTSDSSGYHARLLLRSRAKRCTEFLKLVDMNDNILQGLEELCRIFLHFFDGKGTLPWADELSGETAIIQEKLLKPLNARGLFTINSQPMANGVPSSDPALGWGPRDGYVYQKNYLEFFCSPSHAATIFATLDKYPTIQYASIYRNGKMTKSRWHYEEDNSADADTPLGGGGENQSGGFTTTGIGSGLFGSGVMALTWGVFPGREIIQPTIVSMDSFKAWSGEAFDMWAAPFPTNDVPNVIQMIMSEWILMVVVDNNFTSPISPMGLAMEELMAKIPPLVPINPAPSDLAGSTETEGVRGLSSQRPKFVSPYL
ncbi:methylenetetrahydrofolate reductase (NADPH) [Angomonas deanei]|uniref:Methylenetetrahydrofolate reductase, putative n=1 Tax=Angomonas deanei TaxID=59799 RepID=A0A7G2C3F4_9TRYP|nr:methylenetetrahydrofolate reductase (NADPH) [Angomonas deanei]CAD2214328.1 Methylenetetrahydrofolate reductase, putative [Angomonas deanei]|eukprot:EPY21153.1 methylenetetrahydrofolate reductase (NADPH) [Angomonas deanei]